MRAAQSTRPSTERKKNATSRCLLSAGLWVTVNSAGTFTSSAALVAPFTVKVVNGSKTRVMSAAAPSGDCNSCHTDTGTQNAPGRIMAP